METRLICFRACFVMRTISHPWRPQKLVFWSIVETPEIAAFLFPCSVPRVRGTSQAKLADRAVATLTGEPTAILQDQVRSPA